MVRGTLGIPVLCPASRHEVRGAGPIAAITRRLAGGAGRTDKQTENRDGPALGRPDIRGKRTGPGPAAHGPVLLRRPNADGASGRTAVDRANLSRDRGVHAVRVPKITGTGSV